MINRNRFLIYVIAINILFYLAGKWIPWRVGMFAIERYPYGEPYQILFLMFMSISFFLFGSRMPTLTLSKSILIGIALGAFSSLSAYVLSYSFFYIDSLSVIGLGNIIDQTRENPLGSWAQIVLLSLMLLGWLYGVVLSLFIYKLGERRK